MAEVIEGLSDSEIAAEARAVSKIKAVSNPPIDGDSFKMCGVDVVVPALKAKHLVKFSKQMQAMAKFDDSTPADEGFMAMIPIIHAAMSRNYPSLTTDDVLELLDVSILDQVAVSIMGSSGYRKPAPGE